LCQAGQAGAANKRINDALSDPEADTSSDEGNDDDETAG